MELISEDLLSDYLREDVIAKLMVASALPGDDMLTCQKWLLDSAPKRLIFERLYGDLLRDRTDLRILDVGGGLTSLTRILAQRHDYHLVDVLAHDHNRMLEFQNKYNVNIHCTDWFEFNSNEKYDLIIANDIFPNVDQRLLIFIERFLPFARYIRFSLTYYPEPRFYFTKRVNAEEVLCMLCWDEKATRNAIENYSHVIISPDLGILNNDNRSVYKNGRQVCLMTLVGCNC